VIDSSAKIHPSARIASSVEIGPYSVIGPDVEIGEGTWIGPHVVINGPTKIGHDNKIYQFSSIGEAPQDLKFKGEETFLEIGDRNVIREFCSFNRGTVQDQSMTKVGNDNLFMAYVHLAHDCVVGNHVIFANNASLAGHVTVEDHAILSAFSGVFQFCRIGKHSFITTNSVVIKDVLPYVKASGYYAKPYGLNSVGIQRQHLSAELVADLKKAYRIIYRKGLTITNAIEELKQLGSKEIQHLIEFIQKSERGIVR